MSGRQLEAGLLGVEAFHAEKEAWKALAEAAIEPNPFYEPDFLLAAARHLERADAISLLVIRDAGRPVGLFPLARPRLRDGILFGAQSLYKNAYSSLTTPLLHTDCAGEALAVAMNFLAAMKGGPKVLHAAQLVENRAFTRILHNHAAQNGLPVLTAQRYARAAIETDLDFETYQQRQSQTTRKNLGRKLRKLEAMGPLAFTTINGNTPESAQALGEFLALEASGWKGKRGTALANRPETRAFIETALSSGTGPHFFFERLSLNGKAIAMNLNLLSQRAAYTVKTAYDEAHAALSPGALLDRRTAALVTADNMIARADSCADPGHRIETIWREREPIATLLIGVSPAVKGSELSQIEARMRIMSGVITRIKAIRARLFENA